MGGGLVQEIVRLFAEQRVFHSQVGTGFHQCKRHQLTGNNFITVEIYSFRSVRGPPIGKEAPVELILHEAYDPEGDVDSKVAVNDPTALQNVTPLAMF